MSKYYLDHLLPQLESDFESIRDKIIPEPVGEFVRKVEKEYRDARIKYGVEHDESKYQALQFLHKLCIFSIIFLPTAWLIWEHKLKGMKAKKQELEAFVHENKVNTIEAHKLGINFIDLEVINRNKNKTIKYQHYGPLNNTLLKQLQSQSLFKLGGNNDSNSANTSWGVIDNKVVLHGANQIHRKFEKTYDGSLQVAYQTKDRDGNIRTEYETVSATITKDAYEISNKKQSYTFMTACSNLFFNYGGKRGKIRHMNFNKKHGYAALENSKFEEAFLWNRNDDTQFRMIFTPHTQEAILAETNNGKDMDVQYIWGKTGPFFYNKYKTNVHEDGIMFPLITTCKNYMDDAKMTLDQLMNCLKSDYVNYNDEIFKSLNYCWLTTIFPTDDQRHIIKQALAHKDFYHDFDSAIGYYIINEFFYPRIPEASLPIFYIYSNCKKNTNKGANAIDVDFDLLSYKVTREVEYVEKYASRAGVTVQVPVYYDKYTPVTGQYDFSMAYIPSKYYFERIIRIFSNIENKEAYDILFKLNAEHGAHYKHGILAYRNKADKKVPPETIQRLRKLLTEDYVDDEEQPVSDAQ